MKNFWLDENGAILSVELILIMVTAVIGLVAGLTALRDAIDAKLVELAAASAAIDPGFGFGGTQYVAPDGTATPPSGAWVAGSSFESTIATFATDFTPATVLTSETITPGVTPAIVSSAFGF